MPLIQRIYADKCKKLFLFFAVGTPLAYAKSAFYSYADSVIKTEVHHVQKSTKNYHLSSAFRVPNGLVNSLLANPISQLNGGKLLGMTLLYTPIPALRRWPMEY